MTTGVLYVLSQTTLVATALMQSVITTKTLATSPRTAQTRSPNQEHHITMAGHAPNHIMTTTIGTDPSPLRTDAAKEDTLTTQDHTTVPTMAEAPVSIRGMHSAPHPITIAAHNTHQLTDTLGNTVARTHCIGTTISHLRHTTFPTGVTLETTLWTKADLI